MPFFGRTGIAGLRGQRQVCGLVLELRSAVGDMKHGLVEAQAEDLDNEVKGVAGAVALGPPIMNRLTSNFVAWFWFLFVNFVFLC